MESIITFTYCSKWNHSKDQALTYTRAWSVTQHALYRHLEVVKTEDPPFLEGCEFSLPITVVFMLK